MVRYTLATALVTAGGLFSASSAMAAAPVCDRSCLQGFVRDYAAALIKRDPSGLRVASAVRASEDSVAITLGEGRSWKGITAFKSQPQYVTDVVTQEAAYLGVVEHNGQLGFLAFRLKIQNHQISEAESVLTFDGEGGPAFEPEGMIFREAPYIRDVPQAVRSSRADLVRIANVFWDVSTTTHDAAKVPYAVDCWHFENGMNTNWERGFNANETSQLSRPEYQPQAFDGRIWNCARETYLTTNAWSAARQRHYLVDEERGLILTITNVDYRGRGLLGGPPGAGAPPGGPPLGGPGSARHPIDGNFNGPLGMLSKGMAAAMKGDPYVTAHYMLMRIVNGKIAREQDIMRTLPVGANRIF